MRYLLISLTAVLLLLSPPPPLHALPHVYRKLDLRIFENGLVMVNATLVASSTPLKLELLGRPLKSLPPLVFDENNNPLSYVEKGAYLLIFNVTKGSEVNVMYFTHDLTFKEGPIWTFKVDAPTNFSAILPFGAVVVDLSSVPLLIDFKGSSLLIKMPSGPQYVKYVLTLVAQRPRPQNEGPDTLKLLLLVIPVTAASILLAYLLKFRRRPEYLLTPEEKALIDALKRRGGKAYQSDIASELNLPKTTLWRIVRRLELRGYIKVEKRLRQNFLILIRG